MKQIFNSYKYRIYPNKEQQEYLHQNFGAVRFLWNQLVANFNSYSKDGPNNIVNEKTLKDNPEFSWLNLCISYALQQKRNDFEESKKQFFSKTRKSKLGRMKFKKKGVSHDSFRIPGQKLNYNKCIDFDTNRIKLPKMKPIKIVIDRKFNGTVRSATVSRNKANQYFVSILVEQDYISQPSITGRSVGIDLGLKDFAILSDGTKISNPKYFRENQSKLKAAQKHLSRKTKGSNRYNKQRIKVARIHNKISNQRKYFLHNVSRHIVDNYGTIITESLQVKNMVKNRKLSKSISDASFGMFVDMLAYKSDREGRIFHKIDTFYPSSKTCSCCGTKKQSLSLSDRIYKCDSCGHEQDRDLNASINILNKGLCDLYNFSSDELSDYRRGDEIRPQVAMPRAQSMKRLFQSSID